MNEFEGHGYAVVVYPHSGNHAEEAAHSRRDSRAALHIGRLPGRKQVCLYGHNGRPGTISVFAFFPTEAAAGEALAILDKLMAPKP